MSFTGLNSLSMQKRNIHARKSGVPPPSSNQAASTRNFSLNYDQFDKVFEETIEEEYSISTAFQAPSKNSKKFNFVLPEGEGEYHVTEIKEEFSQKNQAMDYQVDFDMRKTTVDEIVVETKRKRYKLIYNYSKNYSYSNSIIGLYQRVYNLT